MVNLELYFLTLHIEYIEYLNFELSKCGNSNYECIEVNVG